MTGVQTCALPIYSHLTSKYYFFLFFFFSYFFFPLPISLIPFLKLNSHLSLIFIKLSPLLLIHHPLIATIEAHRHTIATKAHHRNIVDSSSFSLFFFFSFSSSTSHLPYSPAPHHRPTLTHLALAANSSPKSQADLCRLISPSLLSNPCHPLRPILTSVLCLGNQFLQSLLIDLQVSCLCLLHHVMLRVFDLGFLLLVC